MFKVTTNTFTKIIFTENRRTNKKNFYGSCVAFLSGPSTLSWVTLTSGPVLVS